MSKPDPLTAPPVRAAPPRSDPPPLERYRQVRAWTEELCEPLETEDYVVQSMPEASPAKWHLAHTTWFFETFLLAPHLDSYSTPDPRFAFLFNSYYNSLGAQHARPERGLLSRPTVREVFAYRHHVDESMAELLSGRVSVGSLLEVGLNHEQQHQESLLTDLKHMLSRNPLLPVYREEAPPAAPTPAVAAQSGSGWIAIDEGLHSIGDDGPTGQEGAPSFDSFAFDNEGPRHRVFLEAFEIADRPVTVREYLEFMADGGYRRAELWLSDGWAAVQSEGWEAPLYWRRDEGSWLRFGLDGERAVDPDEPVCHLSLYEADAYARWAGARLPSEAEWEVAAAARFGRAQVRGDAVPDANFAESRAFHPRPLAAGATHGQVLGDVWEWTRSAYGSYPGYRPPEGALGEYNAKFMNNQTVLRGGSCATPRSHIRSTYRNFFPAGSRWQFSGLRLARDRS